MEFGKHLGKGLWAFADKALPLIYGLGFVVLVIRMLPPGEYGLYVLVQTIYLMLFTVAQSISLQPMLKFVAEGKDSDRYITAGILLHVLFYVFALLTLWLVEKPLAAVLNAEKLVDVLWYVPLLVGGSLLRNIIIVLLQADYRMKEIFWIDAVYFLGSLLFLAVIAAAGILKSADQVLQINVLTFALSSVVSIVLGGRLLKFSGREIGRTVVSLWNFGKYSSASNAGYAFIAQADSLALSWYAGPVSVGVYNAAKVFYRIFDIVAQVIQTFVIPASSRFSAEGNRADLRAMFEKTILFTSVLLLPFSLALLILAPTIMHLFYGTKYDEAIGVLRILALAAMTTPWLATIAGIMVGSGKVRLLFHAVLGFLGITVGALVIFVPLWNIHGAAWALVVSQGITAIVLAVALNRSRVTEVRLRGIFSRWGDIAAYVNKKAISKFKRIGNG